MQQKSTSAHDRLTTFVIAGCITAFVAFLIRRRIEYERDMATKHHLVEKEIDKEIEQDTALTDVELVKSLSRARKLTYDRDGHPILVVGYVEFY